MGLTTEAFMARCSAASRGGGRGAASGVGVAGEEAEAEAVRAVASAAISAAAEQRAGAQQLVCPQPLAAAGLARLAFAGVRILALAACVP